MEQKASQRSSGNHLRELPARLTPPSSFPLSGGKVFLWAALLLGAVALLAACIGPRKVDTWAFGRALTIHMTEARRVESLSYVDSDAKSYVIRPQESGTELLLVKMTVVNEKVTQVNLTLDEEAVSLRNERGDEYPPLDPFKYRQPIEGVVATPSIGVPFLWGPFELAKDLQLTGWFIFEVPKGFKEHHILWDEADSFRVNF